MSLCRINKNIELKIVVNVHVKAKLPEETQRDSPLPNNKNIIAVASGKGGVGKTFIASSLALTISKLGHSVTLVDLDMSGANVHTALGLDPSHLSIRNFFEGQKTLQEIVIPTPYPHLSYIQGFWDSWDSSSSNSDVVERLIPELRQLKADFVATKQHLYMNLRSSATFAAESEFFLFFPSHAAPLKPIYAGLSCLA